MRKVYITTTEFIRSRSSSRLAKQAMKQALSALLILSTLFSTVWAEGNKPGAHGKNPGKANGRQGENTYETTATPTITTLSPTRNKLNVAANEPVAISFSEAMLASTASNAAMRVFGSRTGKRSGTFSGAGTSTATFQASQVFRPGELISVITTTAAQNAGGTALDKPLVYQFTAAAGVGPANFIANPTLTTGGTPHGIYPADFDGDGDMDVAIANAGSSYLTLRLNNGDGTFAASNNVALPAGGSAEAVFAADLDGDGDLDLATANTGLGSISVRMNNGSGVFSGGADYPASATVGSKPSDITGADFDGDGDIDLVTTLKAQNTVAVFINDGTGTFTRNIYVGGSSPHAVCTADFDGDGDMDIAMTNTTSFQVTIKMNDGTGVFSGGSTVATASNSQSIQAVDLNGDGKVDLAAANISTNNVSVRFNNGAGNFSGSTEVAVGNRPFGVYAADLDGDGDMDLMTANQTSNDISIRMNNGSGVFSGTTDLAAGGTQTWALQAADFDGDNDLDIAVVNGASNRYTILLNKLPAGSNTLPTISTVANQSLCANTSSSAIAFTVGDGETPVASLTVAGTSSNTTLIPNTGIVVGGTGANRTVTLTPAANQTGTATITLTVTDGEPSSTSVTFTLTVNALPTVSAGTNQTVCANAAAFALTGFSPAGGVWSGNGVNASGTFTPSASLVGTQTLTYTVTQSGCTASATKTVTVNAAPTVVAGTDQSVCSNAAAFALTGFSPAGGTWSGNGVSASGTFTPSASLVGTQTLTYTVTQSGCTASATKTVTVNALPTVNAGTNQSICADAAAFALTGFSPAGGVWSGNGVNATGTFTPSASLVGTQTLTYTVTQNGCTASATKTVTVNAAPTVVAGSNQSVCSDAAPFALTGFSPAGGTWSGNGVNASGTFTPSASVVGTQTLTYTVTQSGCNSSATKTITVNALPTVNAGANQNICADAAPFALTGFSPAGGIWSGNGVNASGTYTPSASLVGTQTLTYTVTQNGCTNSATKTVTVTTAPTVVAGSNEAVCASAAAFTLTGFSPAGGTWSGNGVSASGTFTPSASLVGTQTLTYTVTQSGCTASATKTLTVNAAPTVVAGADQSVCADAVAFALTGFSPAGGTWSGNGVDAAGTFTPSASLVGTQTLTYTVTQNGCTATATKNVTVNAIPMVNAGSNQTVCASAAPFALTGFSPAGGTWSGNGVSANGTFTPAASMIGTQTLTYTVTQNGCTVSVTKTITVGSEITLSENKINNTDCGNPNGSIHLTVAGGSAPYTIIWNNGATGTHLSALSAGTYSVSVSDAAGCTASQSYIISDPNAPAAFALTGGGSYCEGGTGISVGLSGSENGVTYQLLKDNVAEGTPINGTGSALDFGLKTAAGTYTVRAQNAGACSAQMTGSVSVTVDQKPALNVTQPAAQCAPATVDLTALSVTDTHNTTGTLSYWTDAAATTALPNPASVSASGTYYIKKTTTAGCSDIQAVVVNIQTSLTADAGTDQNVCAAAAPFTLTGFSPAGGTWSGNGVSADGTFTPSASLIGTHTLTYTIAQGNCTATATKTITVTATPSAPVAATNNPTAGESLLLTASTVLGATYQWTGPLNFSSTEQNPVIGNATVAHSGTYTVTVTVNGCTSRAASVQATVNPPVVPASVTLALDSVAGNNGTSVVVQLRVKDFRNILSAQGSIQWNSAVATFAGVESFGLPGMNQSNFGTTQAGNGTLAFSWSDASLTPRTLTDDAALFAIRFNLTGANGTATAVSLTNSPAVVEVIGAGNQPVPTNLKAGNVQVVAMTTLAGVVKSPAGSTIRGVGFNVTGSNSPQSFTTSADGLFNLQVLGGNFTLTPFKNNDVVSANGVTTLDLVLIQRHILGLAPLGSPYKIIAADVNQSGSVTTLDIVLMRSLILQNTTSFPGNQLWAFVRSDYTFADPTHPFPYDHSRTYQASGAFNGQNFIGVKLGDVNDTWDAGIARIETEGEVGFVMENQRVMPGDEITVPVKARDFHNVSGYQFTLNWNPKVLELADVQHQALIANYGSTAIKEGKLSTSWQDPEGRNRTIPNDSTLFSLRFRVIGALGTESYLRINSTMTASEAYNDHLGYLSVVSPERRIQVGEPIAPVYGYELYTGQPNPFSESTLIRFSLPKEEMVTLAIYNSLGQLVKTIAGQYAAGEHQVSWNGTAEAGQRLGSGTYLIQMRAGQFVKSRKLAKVE